VVGMRAMLFDDQPEEMRATGTHGNCQLSTRDAQRQAQQMARETGRTDAKGCETLSNAKTQSESPKPLQIADLGDDVRCDARGNESRPGKPRTGNKVMLNHYCMLANQPRMKARMAEDENTIEFQFVGITNLPDKKMPHMHNGKLTFTDKDNITSSWTLYVDGKASEDHSFELTRKK
jgi:hypothetical protein